MELKHYKPKQVHRELMLLIVPYGIETKYRKYCKILLVTFNRTLWN